MSDRKLVNGLAIGVFVVTAAIGLFVVAKMGPELERPETRTRVVETIRGNGPRKKTTSKQRARQSAKEKSSSATYTLEQSVGKPARKTSLTIEHGSRSLWERALGESGFIGLQVALVILASFILAGLVQRALLGDFAVKFGNFELGALAKGSEVDEKLIADLATQVKRTNELNDVTKEQSGQLATLGQSLQLSQQFSEALAEVIKRQGQELASVAAKVDAGLGKPGEGQ